jgi:hypothetical protein
MYDSSINKHKEILSKYIPESSIDIIFYWIKKYNIKLKISKSRTSKLGDYRPPVKNKFHKISINYDLNKYEFLIILVHEIAHLIIWNKYKNKKKPHSKEWKTEYKLLMDNFFNKNIFPYDISQALTKYFKKTYASSSSDIELNRILNKYDKNTQNVYLEDIPLNTVFKIDDGRIFKTKEKLRKRYKCICLNNNKIYIFNPLVKILPVNN